MSSANHARPTVTAFVLMLAVCCGGIAGLVDSAHILPSVRAEFTQPPEPCVLLSNDNVLFGQGAQVGEFVVIYSKGGGEIRLPRQRVVCWASSIEGLYQYRRDHRSSDDFSARLREANWCLKYDLLEPAAHEIAELRKLDPSSSELTRIERQLEHLSARAEQRKRPVRPYQAPRALAAATGATRSGMPVETTSTTDPHEAQSVPGVTDPNTLRLFASHVQPMLLNRCGTCHSDQSRRGLQLTLPSVGSRASARMTRENLSAALRYVDRDSPDQSELFVRATSPHGGAEAPLSGRNGSALRHFIQWLETTRSNESTSALAGSQPAPLQAEPPRFSASPPASEPNGSSRLAKRPVEHYHQWSGSTTSVDRPDDEPRRLPEVNNPFDPSLFNRRYHPEDQGAAP